MSVYRTIGPLVFLDLSVVKRQVIDGSCGETEFQLQLEVEENMVKLEGVFRGKHMSPLSAPTHF